ncbi:MAG: hypothetical protein M1150_00190 [Patescibacteria group bacterium]|nr:hypothetical protein [Patescibacteria group bacterium]
MINLAGLKESINRKVKVVVCDVIDGSFRSVEGVLKSVENQKGVSLKKGQEIPFVSPEILIKLIVGEDGNLLYHNPNFLVWEEDKKEGKIPRGSEKHVPVMKGRHLTEVELSFLRNKSFE